ncbi:polymeric immunoglobulin receptor-like [Colossoma macropomum]|uniref:polymeric immunoglobulin receptor-like n=1 Tax=Colossoma macropomum TaxID=42526 RepID=UPI001863B82D|nr:polymeric immunoglobulin receptor-like [Colossoma macropomum]
MKILLIFTLFLISVGGGESGRVIGYSGGGVLIKCTYDTQYTSNPKYLCTGLWPCMTKQIWTNGKNQWMNMGRFSLFDDTRAAEFWVLIRELNVEDSGTYKCAVDKSGIDVYTPVELNVMEDQNYMKSISVIGHVGGSVNISCKYPQSHSSDPKFLCRRVDTADCSYKTSVKESRRWINEGKLYLHDDGKQIFTVIINSLTEGDSGEYWCGAESDWTSDHGYKVYITQTNLRVSEQESPTTISSSSSSPSPSSTIPQSTEVTTSPTSISTGNSSMETNSSKEFPASSVITVVCVILVVFLIGLIFMILAVRKRLRPQDAASTPTQPLRGSSNNFRYPVDVYSNTEETGNLPDSDAGFSTVYSSISSPTHPSDPSQHIHDNDQLPTSPYEISDPIYSNTVII